MERHNQGIHKEVIRLNRFLAQSEIASRRKSDELILSGAVKVNGKVVTELGTKIDPEKDIVRVNGKLVQPAVKKIYVVMNKPKDCITTMSDEKGRTIVMDYVKLRQRIYPIGRLDRNTTGVLLLTNDGDFANLLMHPSGEIERVYRVTVDEQITDHHLSQLRKGVKLEDGIARAGSVDIIEGSKRKKVLITLQEGRNREVRRIFEALRLKVTQLDRVSFGGITPLGISRGEWRFLNRNEIEHLKQLAQKKH